MLQFTIFSEDSYLDQLQIGNKDGGKCSWHIPICFHLKQLRGICRVVPVYETARFSPFQASKVTVSLTHSTFESIKNSVRIQLASQWCSMAARCMERSVFCWQKSALVPAGNVGTR